MMNSNLEKIKIFHKDFFFYVAVDRVMNAEKTVKNFVSVIISSADRVDLIYRHEPEFAKSMKHHKNPGT